MVEEAKGSSGTLFAKIKILLALELGVSDHRWKLIRRGSLGLSVRRLAYKVFVDIPNPSTFSLSILLGYPLDD